MNEEPTKGLPDTRSFEERVFARFDASDKTLREFGMRIERLEGREYDTKPIWERALAEIGEIRIEVTAIKTDVAGLKTDVAGLKTDVAGLKTDVAGLKTDVAGLKTDFTDLKADVTEVKYELKEFKREVTKRLDEIQVLQLGNKISIRDAHDRFDKLESRLA